MGRVLGDDSVVESTPGDTLVTSIDAKVQSVVEKQLAERIKVQRATLDPVTGRNFEADSGAAVVLDAKTGRVVAMASQPTYDPDVWTGGISESELAHLYSEKAGTPLLSRATQGQFAPGSTWKPFMTAGALTNGYSMDTRLDCSSSFQVGNRPFRNHESAAEGFIGFARALEVSCNTFFYRIGYDFWQRFGSDPADVDARDPLVEIAKVFGFGSRTGIDLPGEAPGRIADRHWKQAYYESQKDYYCGLAGKPQTKDTSDFVYKFAREFCIEGNLYRAGDAVNFSIGQGDTIVTPLQLARAYAALSNGGTLYAPTVAKALVSPSGKVLRRIAPRKVAQLDVPKKYLDYIDRALQGVTREGTMYWKMVDFPIDKVTVRAKTGSAEVYGKQSTGWVASYTKDYVVVMMISQAGTGSGSTGEGIRAIWEALYGIEGEDVRPARSAVPGTVPPARLPQFLDDGSIMPPAVAKAGE
jgi:penicillin-binding protein 2